MGSGYRVKTYRIISFLRESIRDNQGVAVLKVLHDPLGFTNVSNMRIGKSFLIDVQDDVDIEAIAKEITNPVMEDYRIEMISEEKVKILTHCEKWKLFYAGCVLGSLIGSIVGTIIALS